MKIFGRGLNASPPQLNTSFEARFGWSRVTFIGPLVLETIARREKPIASQPIERA
jgi:hypothetical protein